jgi:hypothetical protein
MSSNADKGSVLVEALAALVLTAAAGAVVAAAASTSLRGVRAATLDERMTAIAARELAGLQARGAPEMADDAPLDEADLGTGAQRQAHVTRHPNGVAELDVTVAVAGGVRPFTLTTRMLVSE